MKDLRLVEFAVTLGRHRHFARAAQAIGIAQPTLSRGIAKLERELGARLFERTTRSVQPTSFGLSFLAKAEGVLEDAGRLAGLHETGGDVLTGQLIVGAGPYALEISVLTSVARLAARHPGLRIRVIEGAWRTFSELLLHGGADVVVVYATIFAGDQRVEMESLPPHPGLLVCRAGHPLTRCRRVSPKDIESYPLVSVSLSGSAPGQLSDKFHPFARHLVVDSWTGDMVPPIATTSMRAAREIIMHTDGIGLSTEPQVRDDVAAGRLAVLAADFALPSTSYAMAWLRGRHLSPPARTFIEVLREVETELAHKPSTQVRRSNRATNHAVRSTRG